jgi:hypothetical protein
MTRTTNARLAGVAFLLYIAAGIASLKLAGQTPLTTVLSIVTSFCALILGVTLYALTCSEDRDIALIGLACRLIEAIPGGSEQYATVFFAVGSTAFAWLLLRGRMIPVILAWLGVIASVLLVVVLLLQRAGLFGAGTAWSASLTWIIWMPMLVFEVAFALWLLTKGVALPVARAE